MKKKLSNKEIYERIENAIYIGDKNVYGRYPRQGWVKVKTMLQELSIEIKNK